MSGTKRTPINRRRLPHVAPAAVALFVELEQVPTRRRNNQAFKDAERELHRMLGLVDSWRLCCNSVLDRSNGPCHPAGYVAHDDWFKVRAVRTALLRAAAA